MRLTTITRSDLICGVCGLGMHISANSGLTHHTNRDAQLGTYLLADHDHPAVADDELNWAGRETPAPTPCRAPLLHFTMTGPDAGTYFCREFVTSMGGGGYGRRLAQDRGAHWALLSDEALARPGICPDCRHVEKCMLAGTTVCRRCTALGYDNS